MTMRTINVAGELVIYTGLPWPSIPMLPEFFAPIAAGAAPVIAGTPEIGEPIVVTSDQTFTSVLTRTDKRRFYVDGTLLEETALADPPPNFPGPVGAIITMRNISFNAVNMDNPTIGDPSNELIVVEDTGGTAFPAKWATTDWQVNEDARTPLRHVTFHPNVTLSPFNDTDFEYFFVCREFPGIDGVDVTQSTPVVSATADAPRAGARTPGITIHSSVQIRRISDGVVENATTGDHYKTQVLTGTGGVAFAEFTQIPAVARTEANAMPNARYVSTGSHFNNAYLGRLCVTTAMAAYKGDAASVTKTVSQINTWFANGGALCSQAEGGYYSQHENNAAMVAFLALRTPAVLTLLNSATKEAALSLIIEAQMYTGMWVACTQNTINPQRTLRGRVGVPSTLRNNNPNISCAQITSAIIGICHFGLAGALAKFSSFSKNTFRDQVASNGFLEQIRLTYNGYTGSTNNPSAAPTPAQMNSALNSAVLDIRGRRVDTRMQEIVINSWKHMFGADSSGVEEVVGGQPARISPGLMWISGNSSTGASPDGNLGIPVHLENQQRRGFIRTLTGGISDTSGAWLAAVAACPFFGQTGQVKEMNGVDDGGMRSAASYAQGTLHQWTFDAICLAIIRPSWFDWRSPEVLEALERARRGAVHMLYVADLGYYNLAKADRTSNGSNTEDWWATASGADFGWHGSFNLVCMMMKWIRDSDIYPALTGPLAQYDAYPFLFDY